MLYQGSLNDKTGDPANDLICNPDGSDNDFWEVDLLDDETGQKIDKVYMLGFISPEDSREAFREAFGRDAFGGQRKVSVDYMKRHFLTEDDQNEE